MSVCLYVCLSVSLSVCPPVYRGGIDRWKELPSQQAVLSNAVGFAHFTLPGPFKGHSFFYSPVQLTVSFYNQRSSEQPQSQQVSTWYPSPAQDIHTLVFIAQRVQHPHHSSIFIDFFQLALRPIVDYCACGDECLANRESCTAFSLTFLSRWVIHDNVRLPAHPCTSPAGTRYLCTGKMFRNVLRTCMITDYVVRVFDQFHLLVQQSKMSGDVLV